MSSTYRTKLPLETRYLRPAIVSCTDSRGLVILRRRAFAMTFAIRASPLSRATSGASPAPARTWSVICSTEVWSTSNSPSAGRTAPMYERNDVLGPTISTLACLS